MSFLLTGALHTEVSAPAFDRKERSVNEEKSRSSGVHRMGGGVCSCWLCQAGGLGFMSWPDTQVLVLSSVVCMMLVSSGQSFRLWCLGKYYNVLWSQGLLESRKIISGEKESGEAKYPEGAVAESLLSQL